MYKNCTYNTYHVSYSVPALSLYIMQHSNSVYQLLTRLSYMYIQYQTHSVSIIADDTYYKVIDVVECVRVCL